jgi:hypothetical protein
MGTCQRLLLLVAIMMLAVHHAAAQTQTLPWPTDPPRPGGAAPWPGDRAVPASPMAASPMGASPMVAVPASPFGGGGGGAPPCVAEFAKLRDDVQKRGLVAKAAGEHKVSREEMCKHITSYSAAELKWVKYTEANVRTCGIPAEVVQQLKQVHTNTEQTKEKICAAAPAPPPPSLSDALGTSKLPVDTKKSAGGTLDTLTGSALAR